MRNAGELTNRLMEDLGMKIYSSFHFIYSRFVSIFIDNVKDGIKYVI
jgi:hypothetical protein